MASLLKTAEKEDGEISSSVHAGRYFDKFNEEEFKIDTKPDVKSDVSSNAILNECATGNIMLTKSNTNVSTTQLTTKRVDAKQSKPIDKSKIPCHIMEMQTN